MPVRFETERFIVRDYMPEDAADAFDMYRREELHRFLLRQPAPDLEFMQTRIQDFNEQWLDKSFGLWAVESKESGKVVATCILKPLPEDERYEVGWHVHPDHWGMGYAPEFAQGALDYGFDSLNLDAIYAILRPENVASRRVAQKLGMTLLGTTNKFHDLTLEFYKLEKPGATQP